MLGMPIVGFDRYTRCSGQMRWRLLDAVPIMRAEGLEVTRSAAGRYGGELLLYLPTAAVSDMITWRAVDEARATAVFAGWLDTGRSDDHSKRKRSPH
jgi:hypothetical protein